MSLLLLSFFGGVLTILSPCVLPLLPIIIGGSLHSQNEKKQYLRPIIITASLALSIVLFTLLLKWSTAFIAVPPRTWSIISGLLIIGLGLITVLPQLWEKFSIRLHLSKKSNELLTESAQHRSWFGALLVGISLGPVFSSCSPTYALILATVLPQSFAVGTVNLIAYAIGLSFVLFLIALFGQRVVKRLQWAANPTGWFKRTIGVLFLLVGVFILLGYDKKIETALVNRGFGITQIEERLVQDVSIDMNESDTLLPSPDFMPESNTELNVTPSVQAPELQDIASWINTQPLSMKELRGKVVLIDFWTYSCINCIRTLPYLNEWNEKYADDGLVIIGVHSPEFAFEKEQENVLQAVEQYDIHYPIGMDNNYGTWRAYSNRYWPAKYFIDRNGRIRHYHFGEGEYEKSEEVIRTLLAEDGKTPEDTISENEEVVEFNSAQTPETYVGYARAQHFANTDERLKNETAHYTAKEDLDPDEWTLSGDWRIEDEKIISQSDDAQLRIRVNAKQVYLVMGANEPKEIGVRLNEELVSKDFAGDDVHDGHVTVNGYRLYTLLEAPTIMEGEPLELTVPAGVELHAFTFGSQ